MTVRPRRFDFERTAPHRFSELECMILRLSYREGFTPDTPAERECAESLARRGLLTVRDGVWFWRGNGKVSPESDIRSDV